MARELCVSLCWRTRPGSCDALKPETANWGWRERFSAAFHRSTTFCSMNGIVFFFCVAVVDYGVISASLRKFSVGVIWCHCSAFTVAWRQSASLRSIGCRVILASQFSICCDTIWRHCASCNVSVSVTAQHHLWRHLVPLLSIHCGVSQCHCAISVLMISVHCVVFWRHCESSNVASITVHCAELVVALFRRPYSASAVTSFGIARHVIGVSQRHRTFIRQTGVKVSSSVIWRHCAASPLSSFSVTVTWIPITVRSRRMASFGASLHGPRTLFRAIFWRHCAASAVYFFCVPATYRWRLLTPATIVRGHHFSDVTLWWWRR